MEDKTITKQNLEKPKNEEKNVDKIAIKHNEMLQLLIQLINTVDFTVEDSTAPQDWQGKKATEILNCQYYSYKHRPDTVIESSKAMKGNSYFMSNPKSFCHFSIAPQGVQRAYSKDSDIVTVTTDLEYWVQSNKQYLVEELIERLSVASCGQRLSVQLGDKSRRVLLTFSNVVASEIEESTALGEMLVLSISVTFIFAESIYSKGDYLLEFFLLDAEKIPMDIPLEIFKKEGIEFEEYGKWVSVPCLSIQWQNSNTQKALPFINNVQFTSTINLSSSKVLAISFDGYMYNKVVTLLTNSTMQGNCKEVFSSKAEEEIDINKNYYIRLTRGEEKYYYKCILQDHKIVIGEEPNNETHTLLFTLTAKEGK